MGEIADYLDTLDGAERDAVAHVYERARAVVPEAEEGTGYGMPALRLRGKPLLAVQVARAHVALYPFSPEAVAAVADELAAFSLSKGTIRFQVDHPVPDPVLDLLVSARRDQILGA
ncbi:iron chaperone [Agromyces sp. SYSU T00194]|uniref:iron chaperone n=1 Tax=Agromyces chitinivorans TaxID=3158560 RepID=UPI0033943954